MSILKIDQLIPLYHYTVKKKHVKFNEQQRRGVSDYNQGLFFGKEKFKLLALSERKMIRPGIPLKIEAEIIHLHNLGWSNEDLQKRFNLQSSTISEIYTNANIVNVTNKLDTWVEKHGMDSCDTMKELDIDSGHAQLHNLPCKPLQHCQCNVTFTIPKYIPDLLKQWPGHFVIEDKEYLYIVPY